MIGVSSRRRETTTTIFFLLAALHSNNNNLVIAQGQNCTPCDIPMSIEVGSKVFGAFNCSEWEADAVSDPADSEICHLNRIAGVAFCGCEVPRAITEVCNLCPNGSVDVNLARELPDVPGVTCEDILEVPQIDGKGTCTLLQQKYAYWCDCPDSEPSCTLCPTGVFPPKPDKTLPFDANLYCGDIATEFMVSTPDQCRELKQEIPIDLASYCECPGSKPPETCQLCPDGFAVNDQVIVENDLTCADIHQIARFSTNETVCEIMEDVHDQCCTRTDLTAEADVSSASSLLSTPDSSRRLLLVVYAGMVLVLTSSSLLFV